MLLNHAKNTRMSKEAVITKEKVIAQSVQTEKKYREHREFKTENAYSFKPF